MDPKIQELLDKQAIQEVVLRYGRTQDWLDDDGQDSCFWPDADIDYGFFKGTGADFVKTVMAHEREVPRRWHLCTSVMIKVEGLKARGECYGIAVGGRLVDGRMQSNMYGGRYLDEFEKRFGQWRISKRTYILDWSHRFPDAIADTAGADFPLHVLDISQGGHPRYRRL